jgi:hypothetical protein
MNEHTLRQNLDLFVHKKNLERFQRLIDETKGEAPDKQLLRLRAEEKANGLHPVPKTPA